MKFRSRPFEIEANQFVSKTNPPIGARQDENGSWYVIMSPGQRIRISLGDWIILESHYPLGMFARVCDPDQFEQWYEKVTD